MCALDGPHRNQVILDVLTFGRLVELIHRPFETALLFGAVRNTDFHVDAAPAKHAPGARQRHARDTTLADVDSEAVADHINRPPEASDDKQDDYDLAQRG